MTSGIIFVIIPYCIIYCIRNFLLYVPLRKVLLNFLEYQLFLTLTVLTVTILFIVNVFLIVLDIFLIHQVLLIISTVTPVSAIAQIYLFFFTVSITYRIYYPFSIVLVLGRIFLSASHIRPFYLRSHQISSSSKLLLSAHCQLSSSPIICLYEVIIPCICVKPLITFWYQLTGICFPNKIHLFFINNPFLTLVPKIV